MIRILTLTSMIAILSSSNSVLAADARSIALGGAVIANGKGVHGALSNPASLMAMQRRGEKVHLRLGFSAEFRDTGGTFDTLRDAADDDLISDINQEIDTLSNSPIVCDLTDGDAPCVTGTQQLSDLSGQLLDIIDVIDGESIEGYAAGDLGVAYTSTKVPFAVNVRVSATAFGTPDIVAGDREYVAQFNDLLDGDSVTLNEILNSDFLFLEDNFLLGVQQPEDVLESSATGGAVVRTQLGVSLATSLTLGSQKIDIGVTPKLSSLTARDVSFDASDEFIDGVESVADRFDDSEVTETSFTADVGASLALPNAPVRVAAVLRNIIPESITTNNGFEFETDPQLILGVLYQRGRLSVSGDVAVNEAKQDNFRTQKTGIGLEYGTRLLAVRGGIINDAARDEDPTSVTLGFGLGPLDVGARLTSTSSLEAGAQLAFSFN